MENNRMSLAQVAGSYSGLAQVSICNSGLATQAMSKPSILKCAGIEHLVHIHLDPPDVEPSPPPPQEGDVDLDRMS